MHGSMIRSTGYFTTWPMNKQPSDRLYHDVTIHEAVVSNVLVNVSAVGVDGGVDVGVGVDVVVDVSEVHDAGVGVAQFRLSYSGAGAT